MRRSALSQVRICDFTGQLAGAGATKILAAFGAQVIRIEDPATGGLWDILRSLGPYLDERRDRDVGGAFNNHNVEKLGITLNLRTERGRELFRELVKRCDVVTENFAAGVLARRGFSYTELRAINEQIIYVSNCGFGHVGPYRDFKSWGPVVQAVCGLTFASGMPGLPPAGWGFSFMDHGGAYFMAIAILMALIHRTRTGEGQWVDMSCTEAGATLNGPAMLDYTVNGRRMRREGCPDSNRAQFDEMAPHGIYPALGDDSWIAIACRDDRDWRSLANALGRTTWVDRYPSVVERVRARVEIEVELSQWTRSRDASVGAEMLQKVGVPAAAVQRPEQRIEQDLNTQSWGLWPTVRHTTMGSVRVDGLPVHLSETDWQIERGAPCLGEHNELVYGEWLGLSCEDIRALREEGTL